MKKFILSAAIIGVGATASFATTIEYTLVGNANYTDFAVLSGRAALETLTIDGVDTDILDGSKYSWALTFSTEVTSSWSNDNLVFSTEQGSGNGAGQGIIATHDGDTITYYLDESVTDASGIQHVLSDYTITAAAGEIVTMMWDATTYTLSLSSATESTSFVAAEAVSLKTGDAGGLSPAATFWTNGGANPIGNISLTATEIPEPSMFGILAGLAAIGFVATRRKRRA
ncbi:MAG: PEP-CTERM sorting domain-containing protein [Opitutae bacterium]|nr:PEP-CTERM sorting domain-containing protein [Opitutae bacterium]